MYYTSCSKNGGKNLNVKLWIWIKYNVSDAPSNNVLF